MLLALGMRAYNDRGEKVGTFGKDLRDVKKIDLTALDPRLKEVHLHIASDVDNPLYGKNGASKIYGPQKGMTEKQVEIYDAALKNYSQLLEHALKNDSLHQKEVAGAAGGLGFALLALGGKVISGAQFIAQKLSLEKSIQQADVVLTGEGQSDHQTLYGKAPGYIATLGKKYDIPVLLLSGGLKDVEQLNTLFTSCFSDRKSVV